MVAVDWALLISFGSLFIALMALYFNFAQHREEIRARQQERLPTVELYGDTNLRNAEICFLRLQTNKYSLGWRIKSIRVVSANDGLDPVKGCLAKPSLDTGFFSEWTDFCDFGEGKPTPSFTAVGFNPHCVEAFLEVTCLTPKNNKKKVYFHYMVGSHLPLEDVPGAYTP